MTTAAAQRRRVERELKTVNAMIDLYCRSNHHGVAVEALREEGELCAECRELWEYAEQRVDNCPFGAEKPTCLNCPVHCYKAAMRERIRVVMRFAGPRMTWRHPILALAHVVDGRRKAVAARRARHAASPVQPTAGAR